MVSLVCQYLGLAGLLVGGRALAAEPEAGCVSLFNGRDLTGWDGKPGGWRVEDGFITGESTPAKPCTKHHYLIWRGGEPADFELRFEYRLQGGNSGVQFRSREVADWDMRGYQADFEDGPQWTGALFEHTRGGLALRGEQAMVGPDGARQVTRFAEAAALQKLVRTNGWNEYRVVARGPEIQLFVNGRKTAHVVDRQTGRAAARGLIGLQMHPGPPMKVQFRNLRLKEFPPAAAATPAAKLVVPPGFKAELVCAPAPDSEGSWVSLCVDARGRLLASGQYDEGLFRVTVPGPGDRGGAARIEKLPVNLSGAQGLCWAFDSLYAVVTKNGRTPSGLYRVRDTDGDDMPDSVELLRALEGGGDHGWHAVLPWPDGRSLCVVAGNNTQSPPLAGSRVPPHWSEDHLLPRMPDAGGHMVGVLAPGGVIYRVSPDGRDWEMFAHGFRNTYDAAFNAAGDLFTYDADMEWDLGTPWYRPTRICHVTSGGEFGWRNGTGKWPAFTPDSLPGILDLGPGSPTGVAFGHGTKFPARYRETLFAADWTFGRIHAISLQPAGATYRAEPEVFVSGVPLPVTDLVVNPADGALYFITGGWRIPTGLYRVSWVGSAADEVTPGMPCGTDGHALRKQLESFHGRRDPAAVEAVWPHLGSPDRFVAFAARVALEWQDPAGWRERALQERAPGTALPALLALVRVSAKDEFHRPPGGAAPDPSLQARVLEVLAGFDWARLTSSERLGLLRACVLCFTRMGPPPEDTRVRLARRLEAWFPAGDRALDSVFCELLVYLQSSRVAAVALGLVRAAPTQEEQLDYIKSLRMLRAGWTPELRREFFAWFNRAAGYRGGASFAGFLKRIKADALAPLSGDERAALRDILEAPAPASPAAAHAALLAGRTNTTEWTVARLAPALAGGLKGRDVERGRRLFGATGCFQCHRVAGEGGAVGPDLTHLAGRFSPRDMLEAILEPGKAVSDLYGNVVLTRRDGERLVGRIVYHTQGGRVSLSQDMFNPAETVQVDRKDIVDLQPSPVSPMPEGLLASLTEGEILDLLAFLQSAGESGAGGGTPSSRTPPASGSSSALPSPLEMQVLEASGTVECRHRGRLLFTYAFASNQFKPYVRTLNSLRGDAVLRDAPADHLHHHGLMYAIRVNGVNFWEERDHPGHQRHVQLIAEDAGRDAAGHPQAGFTEILHWVPDGDAGSADTAAAAFLIEKRTLTLTVDEAHEELALAWHAEFEVGGRTNLVTLHGSDYNGLGLRLPAAWNRVARPVNSEGAPWPAGGKPGAVPARWAAVSHVVDGRSVQVAILARSRGQPGTNAFFAMTEPFTYLSATQGLDKSPLSHRSGQRFTLDYLVLVQAKARAPAELESRFQAWSEERKSTR